MANRAYYGTVKRRFIRQNREIARVNSTQSLRIRNLESEITRLLSENIAFRQRAIKSEQEVQRLRCYQDSLEEVGRLKDQLETSLQQASSLVTKLQLPIRGQKRDRGTCRGAQTQSLQGRRNERLTEEHSAKDREVQDGRLPPIAEGKYYPRKTLESSEIRFDIGDAAILSESPELGPPPIAHFEVSDPSEPDVQSGRRTTLRPTETDDLIRENLKPLPENLEKRRKRRVSSLIADMPQSETTIEADLVTTKTLTPRAGEKRKLNVHEDEEKTMSPSAAEGFQFRTKSGVSEPTTASAPVPASSRSRGTRFTKHTITSTSSSNPNAPSTFSRKILAPKSTNSPSKNTREDISIKSSSNGEKRIGGTRKDTGSLEKRLKIPALPANDSLSVRGLETPGVVPDTPKELLLSSPPSTQGSVLSGQKKEMTMTASVEDVLGGTDGRSSRRARGAVSYAEPSLRAKMRRATKELAPAVGDQTNGFKQQQPDPTGRADSQEAQFSQEHHRLRAVTIKKESSMDDSSAWKGLPNVHEEPTSPLVSKVARHLTSQQSPQTETASTQTLGSNSKTLGLEQSLHNLTIFDGPEASPPESAEVPSALNRRASRRHSSVVVTKPKIRDPDNAVLQTARSAILVDVADQPPRPSSAASVYRRNEKAGLKKSTSVSGLNSLDLDSSMTGVLDTSGQLVSRTERAAARRRSMVV